MAFKLRQDDTSYELLDPMGSPVEQVGNFLRTLELRNLSPLTIRAYAYDLLIFYRWLHSVSKELNVLKQSDLFEFIATQKNKDICPKSINRRLSTIDTFYQFCTGNKLENNEGVSLPARHYKQSLPNQRFTLSHIRQSSRLALRVKEPKKLVDPLEKEQICLFLGTLSRYRDICIVHMMLLCGLRSREIITLNSENLRFSEKQLLVHGKGNKERILPLPNSLINSIEKYIQIERPKICDTQRLFVVLQGKQKGQPMTPEGLRSIFRHRRKNSKLSNANPHRFRHTFGADMARNGVQLLVLQRLMGHANFEMTLQYINISLTDIADEFQRAVKNLEKHYQLKK